MESLPRIRAGLLRHELDGQVLVYDPRHDRVHLLDPTTGCVLELLQEGGWTAEGVIAEVGARLNIDADSGLVSHTAFIGKFDGPYPFYDESGLID